MTKQQACRSFFFASCIISESCYNKKHPQVELYIRLGSLQDLIGCAEFAEHAAEVEEKGNELKHRLVDV